MQMSGPDGKFAAATKVGLAPTHKAVGDYVWAYATGPDGRPTDGKTPQGYVPKSAITMDPQGHVLAEMDGPGCVVRLWSANPGDAGNIRIYLDGADKPVIEAPLKDLLGGEWKTKIDGRETTPFPDPIACERSRGFNLYFPIAYAKHCKVTIDKPDIYYHVDYRTYPKGTEVETFSLTAWASAKLVGEVKSDAKPPDVAKLPLEVKVSAPQPAVDLIVRRLADGQGMILPTGKDVHMRRGQNLVTTEPGDAKDLWSDSGTGVVVEFVVQVPNDKNLDGILRGLVLIGTFDGAERPQVWCPLGDFFGSSPGFNPYRSLPMFTDMQKPPVIVIGGKEEKWCTFVARWWMPYQKTARFQIRDYREKESPKSPVSVLVTYSPDREWTDRSLHFHAKWRTADLKTRPFRDWPYCDLKGKGVFVGDMLSVMNPTPAWWGEGDEKIYVDGEKFPSWFGTGSEDYYGYAWSDPTPFQHAYHNQTRCDGKGTGGTFGLSSVNRFHVLDCIPFETSFRFDMEVWHWAPKATVNYAATSYWYARPDATDDFEPVDAKVLQSIPAPPPPFKIEGALEGESLKILGKSSDFPLGRQDLKEFTEGQWSGDAHLWGRPPKVGEWADLEVPVAADGKYKVVVYLTKARDYGVVQFSLDGKPLGKPLDGFEPDKVVSTGPVELGTVELKKGTAVLRVEVTGTNEKSVGLRYMWGLDCVVLKPV
jgi:hypothetical protein